MKRTADYRTVGDLLVLRQNSRAASDRDWTAFLNELRRLRHKFDKMRALVFTDGGGPTPAQRKLLTEAMDRAVIQTAVITDVMAIRFVVSSVALFNKAIRTFPRQGVHEAYAWLGLSVEDVARVEAMLAELNESVALDSSHSVRPTR